ncbi:hypothetical protein FZ929_16610 [Klebsiella pneumoniae]|uniref:Uncharacterized protein n=1 Tax=Klebsiella pneumoniae TaxID=573 RepID=A0A5C2LI87_KLEPN|nr:hypothetical protein FZ929_16610 [Klebsiella pneumoniae]
MPYVGLTADDARRPCPPSALRALSGGSLPETAASGGIIESEVVAIPAMKRSLEQKFGQPISGELLLKKTAICRSPDQSKRAVGFMKC